MVALNTMKKKYTLIENLELILKLWQCPLIWTLFYLYIDLYAGLDTFIKLVRDLSS